MLYVWYMTAVCQIGFSKQMYLDHSTWMGEPNIYTPTKFRENILIGGRDMPSKQNSKQTVAAEFYFQFQY